MDPQDVPHIEAIIYCIIILPPIMMYVCYCYPGPLPETVKDFWQMIWDHKLQTIVMLTKPVEAGTPKCAIYWPEKVNET